MKKFRIEFIIGIVIVVAMVLVVVFGMQEKDITEKKFHSDNLTAPASTELSDEPSEAPTEKIEKTYDSIG